MDSPVNTSSARGIVTKIRRGIIACLFILLATVIGLEILLKVFDPWGADENIYGLSAMWRAMILQEDHRILPDDTYTFRHWSATIQDGVRMTPDTNPIADCHIAVMGDSLTFGYGVNDDETWVNQLAKQNPQVKFENYGLTGYNSRDSRNRMRGLDADGFLYLLYENDTDDVVRIPEAIDTYEPAISAYVYFIRLRQYFESRPQVTAETLPARFVEDMQFFSTAENILMIGFDDFLTQLVRANYKIAVIPDYEASISVSDNHPTPAENINIARNMQPHVEKFIADVCPELNDA